MGRIVKEEVLSNMPIKDIKFTEKNMKNGSDVDLGYGTRAVMRKCSGLKDIDILIFRRDCRNCLRSLLEKLMEKCPIKYPLTEALTFLNPHKIVYSTEDAVQNMSKNIICSSTAGNANREYRELGRNKA